MILTKTTDVGTATVIGDRILEVRIHSGIELSRETLLQGYQQLADLAGGHYALLVDRTQTDYSVGYDAMVEGANHPSLVAQALLIPPYNQHKKLIAETILDYPRKSSNPIRIFSDRNQAITWLNENLLQAS
jgi:hypothetical protein